jgi:WD40 repeat protein
MRVLAAAAGAAVALAGCGGAAESGDDSPASLVVAIRTNGALSTETFTVEHGTLMPGELDEARVYASAGDKEPEEGISFEEIYLVDPGGEPKRLTSDRRFDHSPALLRDGRVAFVSCPLPAGTLLPSCSFDAIEPASGERKTIAGRLGFVWNADLAPDEKRLLLTRITERAIPTGVSVRDLRTGKERFLAAGAFGRWSPDGERIAFVSDRDENGSCLFHNCSGFANEIYVMDASGGDFRRLTGSAADEAAADWTGDGEWIVFGRITDEEDDWDLWAVRADGECEVQLTDTKRWEIDAEWHGPGDGGLSC